MQVFTLCFLFLAAGILLVPGIALSQQSSRFIALQHRSTAAGSVSRYQGADREQGPIRIASIFHQNFSNKRASAALAMAVARAAIVAIAHHRASKIGGRPEASQ